MKRLLLALAAVLAIAAPAQAIDFGAGATATAVASDTADVQGVAASAGLRLLGFSCRENAGSPAAAEFIIRNGTAASDPPVAFVKLAASESVREFMGDAGISCPNGIFIDRVTGTTEITIFSKQ